MNMRTLPRHPNTGLMALGIGKRGPIWPVLGGAEGTEGAPPPADKGGAESTTEGKTFTQADLDRVIGERLARERENFKDYDSLKAAADELAKIKDGQKTELEKSNGERDELKARLAEVESSKAASDLALLRREIASDKGLTDPKLVKRVGGGTREEIEADVVELLEVQGVRGKPKPNPQQGNPSSGTGSSIASGRERYLARHGKK